MIVGESQAIRRLRALVERAGPLPLPVLIQGPTGSGKELVARELHARSARRGRLVAFNVCAVAESMFEAALFGHVRGAFTGAVGDARGYFAEADGGTLFMDEVSGLALPMQAKLLRVLETREFRPVGGRTDTRSDFRLVAATNEDLHELAESGRFRADLAHRLDAVAIHVPALAERAEDIPMLVEHFARGFAGPHEPAAFTPDALRVLQAFHWPGNVRQLRNVVERAAAFSDGGWVDADAVATLFGPFRAPRAEASPDPARGRFLEVLRRHAWDTAGAARELGVHRSTVYRQMERLGIRASRS